MLESFFSGLEATLKTAEKVRKVYDRDLALEFNPLLKFFRIGENKLSEILAFFLNAGESHGQGDVFLKSFLRFAGLEERVGRFGHFYVATEKVIHNNRRLDIYLNFDHGRFIIGIENKIWAGDQVNQLRDYNSYLSSCTNEYCLIYLTPYNHTPGEHSISTEEIEQLSAIGHYKFFDHSQGLSNLLLQWIADCRADKVRTFLKDLYQYIQHTINGISHMGQTDLVADFILSSRQNLDTAFTVQSTVNIAIQKLFEKFRMQLQELGQAKGWPLIDFSLQRSAKPYTHFTFKIVAPHVPDVVLWFRFQFDAGWNNGLMWGILTDGKERPEVASILENGMGKPDGSSKFWAWWKWDERKNWDSATFIQINEGAYIKRVELILDEYIPNAIRVIEASPDTFWKTPAGK